MPHDVIVIGLGGMGAATCCHLARRGVRVLGLEQHSIAHAFGSSHGESRVMRLAYFEHPDYVPLLRRGLELWDELNELSGRDVLIRTGGFYAGCESDGLVAGTLDAARAHDVVCEALTRNEAARRFPQIVLDEDQVAVMEPEAGVLVPETAIEVHAALAAAHGAELRTGVRVRRWRSDGSGIVVETDAGELHAEQLIICAGAWSSSLLGGAQIPLTVTRQVFGWLEPRDASVLRFGALPVWGIMHRNGVGLYYGFPMSADADTVKVALHQPTEDVVDPDTVERSTRDGDEATFRDAIERHLPAAAGPLREIRVCMYTNTPDANFIVDRHPAHENVLFAAGFSGHGFKFCAVMGEALAELAMHGRTRHPIGFLGLSRFA